MHSNQALLISRTRKEKYPSDHQNLLQGGLVAVQIPLKPRARGPKKRPIPEDSDQDDEEEASGAEQHRAKRRKRYQFGQDNSKDYNPPEGDDDSSDDPFLDEPKRNKSKIKGKGKATRGHLEPTFSQPEQVPDIDENGDVSNLLLSWSEDDQTLLDSLPTAEIALWRKSMRLFGVGPEELFPPNVTISRADIPDYTGKDNRRIANNINLTTNFCDTFKYIISLPLLAKNPSLIQYLLTKALRLRCGDRYSHGDHFPEHFHFYEHLKDVVKANSGMKPRKGPKNTSAGADEDGDFDTNQLRTRDLNNIIKAWDSYRNDSKNSHHFLPSMKEYYDGNKLLKNRKGEASQAQVKLWKKNWVLLQRRRQLRLEKHSSLRTPLGDEIHGDNMLSDDAEGSSFNLGLGGRSSSDEGMQDDYQVMVDDEPFGTGMVPGDRSPVLTGPPENQIIEPPEVLATPKGPALPNPSLPDAPSLPNIPAPDRSIEVRCTTISGALDSKSAPGFQHATIISNAIAKYTVQWFLDDEDNTLVRQLNESNDASGKTVRENKIENEAYAYLHKLNLAAMNAPYLDTEYLIKYAQPIVPIGLAGKAIMPLELRPLGGEGGDGG
ncbi:hypothetical protein EAF04_003738 [Stromatinia cepivora]|nr:hypothetical protein EAF04_003738 [Stromatinia cepivora]